MIKLGGIISGTGMLSQNIAAKGGVPPAAGKFPSISEIISENKIDNLIKGVKNGYGWADVDYILDNPHVKLEDGEKAVALIRLAKLGMLVDIDKINGNPESKNDIPKNAFMSPKDVAKKYKNLVKTRYQKEDSVKEAKSYNTKADALNAYMKGDVSAEEIINIAKEKFGSEVATPQELDSFLKNKFMQDVMADTYGISASQLVKKVKELKKLL